MVRSLVGFLPWIVYAFVATGHEWRWGAITGLVIAVVLVVVDRRTGKGWDQTVIETSAVVFFALLTAYSLIRPQSGLTLYGPALVNGWLALTAWGSLAIRKPFTLGIARSQAPEEVWKTPRFYRVNVVITSVWAIAFTVAAVVLAIVLAVDPHATALVITVKVASFAVPAIFTVRYTQVVQNRLRALGTPPAA